jgi:chromosome segregation ATPase
MLIAPADAIPNEFGEASISIERNQGFAELNKIEAVADTNQTIQEFMRQSALETTAMKQEMAAMNRHINAAESTIGEFQSQVDLLVSQINEGSEKSNCYEDAINNLKNSNTVLHNSNTALQNEVLHLQNNSTALKNELAQSSAAHLITQGQLQGQVTQLQGVVANLQAQNDGMVDYISHLDDRFEALENHELAYHHNFHLIGNTTHQVPPFNNNFHQVPPIPNNNNDDVADDNTIVI